MGFSSANDLQDILDPKSSALLIIDMQNDFCSPKGAIAQRGGEVSKVLEMGPQLASFVTFCRETMSDLRIIHVITHHSKWTNSPAWSRKHLSRDPEGHPVCVPNTWGAEIFEDHTELQPSPNETVVIKHRYSAFVNTDLDLILKAQQIKTLLIAGTATNVCVESTARHAHMLDYHVVFLCDLTATSDPGFHESSLQNIQKYFGYVTASDDIQALWLASTK